MTHRGANMFQSLLLALLVASAGSSMSVAAAEEASVLPEYEGFIRIQNGRFVDSNCQQFPVTGMNSWMLMEAAAGLAVIPCDLPGGMDAVQYTFTTAAANGFTVVRAFAHGVNNTLPLQISPGVYNETAFAALDYILDTAAYNGVKLIFTMGDNWQYADAKRNYNAWAGFNESSDLFWTSEVTKQMYKDHMSKMVNRVNTLNGIRYGDDPTIFAWNLMNEPRCDCFPAALPYPPIFSVLPAGCAPSCTDLITAWVGEMADHLKALDSNHLVTVGEEGFWGFYDSYRDFNPEDKVSPWASLTGNNFTAQHSFDSIDFAAIHYWPDQWTPKATSDAPFFTSWMQKHEELALALGKPLILEELGKGVVANSTRDALESSILTRRQPFMELVYGQFNQSLQAGGVWRGTLFWMWGLCPQNTDDSTLQVAAGDADFKSVIAPASLSAMFQAAYESPVQLCTRVAVMNETALAPLAATAPQQSLPVLPSSTAKGSSSRSSGSASSVDLPTAG